MTFEGPQPSLGSPQAVVADNGRIVVAWHRGFPRSLSGVWVAVRGADGRLGSPRPLGPSDGVLTRRSAEGVRTRVSAHVRTRSSGWRATTLGAYAFNPAARTSHVTSRLRALPLITSDGRIRVVWPSRAGGHVRAAVTSLRATRSALGERALLGSRVAFDPASGRPSVLWTEGGSPQGYRPMLWTSLAGGAG